MSVTVTLSEAEAEVPDPRHMTFMERVRMNQRKRKPISANFPRALFCYLFVSGLYTFCCYLAPYSYKHWGDWRVYQFKVLYAFCAINCMANLICVIFYDTTIKRTKDRPGLPRHLWEKPPDRFIPYLYNHSEDGRKPANGTETSSRKYTPGSHMEHKDGLPWRYCDKCDLDLPPRAIHCSVCNKCILKRDHHCYLTGVCVGHYNQRYFIVFAFFGMVTATWKLYHTYFYVMEMIWDTITWWDFFPPCSALKVLAGNLNLGDFCMIHHLWMLPVFSFAGFAYFVGQMVIVLQNKTLYEFTKVDNYRSTTSISRNLRSVFGDFWAINFIFPAQIIFRQSDDGFHWEGLKLRRLPEDYRTR